MSIRILKKTITKTNETPLQMAVEQTSYPVAPLVFAEDSLAAGTYKLRIVAYLPSEVIKPPRFTIENNGTPYTVIAEGGKELMVRSFILDYDYSATLTPVNYNMWSIFIEYGLEDGLQPVDYILTRLRDIDPKTSRGTVTTVQLP